MKRFKEKPKLGELKEKPTSALLPKQAARMMKEKYIKRLDPGKPPNRWNRPDAGPPMN